MAAEDADRAGWEDLLTLALVLVIAGEILTAGGISRWVRAHLATAGAGDPLPSGHPDEVYGVAEGARSILEGREGL